MSRLVSEEDKRSCLKGSRHGSCYSMPLVVVTIIESAATGMSPSQESIWSEAASVSEDTDSRFSSVTSSSIASRTHLH